MRVNLRIFLKTRKLGNRKTTLKQKVSVFDLNAKKIVLKKKLIKSVTKLNWSVNTALLLFLMFFRL